uniref:Uncharacterized protein n=1 Tax=Anguilla anguilla TaxID=7936 RepID=A0A0E9VNX7_ANGAN
MLNMYQGHLRGKYFFSGFFALPVFVLVIDIKQ